MTGVLHVTSNESAATLGTGGPVSVGRASDCDIVVAGSRVSRHHGRFVPDGERWIFEDTQSTGGTYVNGQRVSSVEVADGLVLRLGSPTGPSVVVTGSPAPADSDATRLDTPAPPVFSEAPPLGQRGPLPSAGWYADPGHPGQARWWDGRQWAPGPVAEPWHGQPEPSPSGSSTVVKVIGGIIVAVLALIGALVVAASLSPSTTATRSTCAELADEAVRISAEQNTGTLKPLLLKVRDTAVVVDNQNDLTPPASGERTLLECRGVGVFSGLPNTTVVLRMTVDSDGDVFVAYEAG